MTFVEAMARVVAPFSGAARGGSTLDGPTRLLDSELGVRVISQAARHADIAMAASTRMNIIILLSQLWRSKLAAMDLASISSCFE